MEYYYCFTKKLIIILLGMLATTNGLIASELVRCDTFSLNSLQRSQNEGDLNTIVYQVSSIIGFELPSQNTSFQFVFCRDQIQDYSDTEIDQMVYLASAYFEYTLLEEAKLLFEAILIYGNQTQHSAPIIIAHNYLGVIADLNNDWLTAYFHFQKILEWEDKNSANLNFSAYLNLGALATAAKDFDKAASFFQKGLALNQKEDLEYGWLLHRIGELRQIKQDYEGAKVYLTKANAFWQKKGYLRGFCISTLRLGTVYFENKETQKALELAETLINSNSSMACELCKTETFLLLSKLYFQKKAFEKAKYYLMESKKLAEKENFVKLKKVIYETQIQNVLSNNKLKGELNLFEKYKDLNQEMNSTTRLSTTKSMKYIDNLVKKVRDYNNYRVKGEKIKLQMQQQRLTIIVIVILLIMTTLLMSTFFSFNRKNSRSKKRLEILNQEIMAQREALNHSNKKLNSANTKIETQNQELHLQLVKKAMLMQQYGELIKGVKKLAREKDFFSQKGLIINKIDQANTDDIETELNLQITNANQDLLESLSKEFPNLTQNEKRLCALLKMNLSTKEIANITFRTPESVKVARSRLRKKLGLTHQKVVIGSFLNQFEV